MQSLRLDSCQAKMIYVKVAVIPPPSFVLRLCVPEYFLPPALEVELLGNESIFQGRGRQKLLLDLQLLYLDIFFSSHTGACAFMRKGLGVLGM